jgi:hypothetical protein
MSENIKVPSDKELALVTAELHAVWQRRHGEYCKFTNAQLGAWEIAKDLANALLTAGISWPQAATCAEDIVTSAGCEQSTLMIRNGIIRIEFDALFHDALFHKAISLPIEALRQWAQAFLARLQLAQRISSKPSVAAIRDAVRDVVLWDEQTERIAVVKMPESSKMWCEPTYVQDQDGQDALHSMRIMRVLSGSSEQYGGNMRIYGSQVEAMEFELESPRAPIQCPVQVAVGFCLKRRREE